ncbi:MAG: hypothetical protein RIS97_202, partial [Pseudomonadota bacterium]
MIMTNTDVVAVIAAQQSGSLHDVWVGTLGYDTRPSVAGKHLPVAHD